MSRFFKISWSEIISSEVEPDFPRSDQEGLEPFKRLYLAKEEIKFCEKLHSYFHFEQAFFHLKIAETLLSLEECQEAIKPEPFNLVAKQMEELLLVNQALDQLGSYERPFTNYQDFLIFLGCDKALHRMREDSYWHYYELYLLDNKIDNLYLAKNSVIAKHQEYHLRAAEAYYNRALSFQAVGEEILAKNDLVKAKNLNPKIIIPSYDF